MARQSEGRWIARAAVGILHGMTTIEIRDETKYHKLAIDLGHVLKHFNSRNVSLNKLPFEAM